MPLSQHDPFDPYLEWLCIPITQRPPTYYDLLGLRPFESKIETIREHAQARYRLVHQYQVGRRGEMAVRVLAELAQARDVLCDPHRKAQYDTWLLAQGSASCTTPAAVPSDAGSTQLPQPLPPPGGAWHDSTVLGSGPSDPARPVVSPAPLTPSPAQHPRIAGSTTGHQGGVIRPLHQLAPAQPHLPAHHPTLAQQPLLGQQVLPSQPRLPNQQPSVIGYPPSSRVPQMAPHVPQEGTTPYSGQQPIAAVSMQQSSHIDHSFGVASLVIGVISILICWIPIMNTIMSGFGLLLGLVSIVLSIICNNYSGIGYAIAGSYLSAFTFSVSACYNIALFEAKI